MKIKKKLLIALSLFITSVAIISGCTTNLKTSENQKTSSLISQDHRLHIIMIGAPSSGKGTHASIISQKYGIPHISVGDLMRAEVKSYSELASKINSIMSQGRLVPDEITMQLLEKRLSHSDCKKGYILDGAPRSEYQAELINKKLSHDKKNVNIVLNLDVADEVLVGRVETRAECGKCNAGLIKGEQCKKCRGDEVMRADDNSETFKKRLDTHHKNSDAVVNYFKNHSDFIVINIDGHGEVKDVSANISNSIDHFLMYKINANKK